MWHPKVPHQRPLRPKIEADRVHAYLAQTGRPALTPRQRRRVDHKARHASTILREALHG